MPNICLSNIIQLKNSQFIRSNESNIYKAQQMFKKVLSSPLKPYDEKCENIVENKIKEEYLNYCKKEINLILPFLDNDYFTIINEILNNNIKIRILLKKPLLNLFLSNLNNELVSKSLRNNILKIRVCESSKILFCSNNNVMSLGLFKWNGEYDQNQILISQDNTALKWGNILFDSYYSKGKTPYLQEYR
ncbi:MAG: transcriptional regulator FilR1 domain-containing protein [Methanobacteriaceae archaeon]